jgi:hypothetical protein
MIKNRLEQLTQKSLIFAVVALFFPGPHLLLDMLSVSFASLALVSTAISMRLSAAA